MSEKRDVVVITTLTKDRRPGEEHRVGTVPAGTRIVRKGEIAAFDELRAKALAGFSCIGVHDSLHTALVQAHRQSAEVTVVRIADVFPRTEAA